MKRRLLRLGLLILVVALIFPWWPGWSHTPGTEVAGGLPRDDAYLDGIGMSIWIGFWDGKIDHFRLSIPSCCSHPTLARLLPITWIDYDIRDGWSVATFPTPEWLRPGRPSYESWY